MCKCTCIKVRVSMPEELVSSVKALAGASGFSQYVADAVEDRHRHDLLGELLDEFVAEHGPLDEDLVREAAKAWKDDEPEEDGRVAAG
jgi:hypothetical protein